PVLTQPANQTSVAGAADSFQLAASDPDGNPLTYSATGLPPTLSVTASTGMISGTPTTAGTFTVTATVSDGTLTNGKTFTWTVSAANGAPVLTQPANQTSVAGTADSFQLVASDPDGNPLTYTATGLPAALSVNASTGMIAGTPTTAGTFTVTATASDGTLTNSKTFTWTVSAAANQAPVLTQPANQTSVAGTADSFQLV